MGEDAAPPLAPPVRIVDRAGVMGTDTRDVGGPAAGPPVTCVLADGEPDAIAAAAHDVPGALVLALVPSADRAVVSAALDAGAAGVALRDAGPAVLARAAEALAAGFVVVPAAGRAALRRPVFTTRQKEVLSLLVLGLSNADIAARLFISEATVKMHLSMAFRLLGVSSRKEAVALVLDRRNGLGPGILKISEAPNRQEGYGRPIVE